MIVVMKTGATEAQIIGVQKQIRELGFKDHRIHGEERNVVAVLGHVYPELVEERGEKGLHILAAGREQTGLPIITEVMDARDVELVARFADILQIGARNMQNFMLLDEVGRAGKPGMLKRGPP